jgi:hypothetical protein
MSFSGANVDFFIFNYGLLNGFSRESAVGIATGYGLDDRRGRSSSPCRDKNFLYVVQTGSEGPPSLLFTGGTVQYHTYFN